jgi:hypothetical protein
MGRSANASQGQEAFSDDVSKDTIRVPKNERNNMPSGSIIKVRVAERGREALVVVRGRAGKYKGHIFLDLYWAPFVVVGEGGQVSKTGDATGTVTPRPRPAQSSKPHQRTIGAWTFCDNRVPGSAR